MYLGEGATVKELVRYGHGVSAEKLLDLIDSVIEDLEDLEEENKYLRTEARIEESIELNNELLLEITNLRAENLELKVKLELANGNTE